MRDKNGRFIKSNLEIPIPSGLGLLKIIVFIFIFLPWIYILFFRLELSRTMENAFDYLFDSYKACKDEKANGKNPY